jgi:hypothetical protein
MLITGGSFMVISQYIVGAIGSTSGKNADTASGQASVRAMIAFICLNISAFAMTWGPTAWVVVGEIFPLPIRSRGVGLSTSSNWFWNCVSITSPHPSCPELTRHQIIAVITPYLVGTGPGDANLGAKVFFLWGSLCILAVLFAYFFVPEMKGLSLEQVDKMLEEVGPRQSGKWKPHSTFASELGLTEKGLSISATPAEVHERVGSVGH